MKSDNFFEENQCDKFHFFTVVIEVTDRREYISLMITVNSATLSIIVAINLLKKCINVTYVTPDGEHLQMSIQIAVARQFSISRMY